MPPIGELLMLVAMPPPQRSRPPDEEPPVLPMPENPTLPIPLASFEF